MGYDELQRTLANVKENKDLFKSRIADSGLFKRGFSGEWEKVQPKDFEEKLGKKGYRGKITRNTPVCGISTRIMLSI